MKKILIALTALVGITCLSGCADWYYHPAYGYGYGYGYGYHPYAYSSVYHPYLGQIDCVHHFDATVCAHG